MSAKLTNRDVILYINYLYKFMLRIVEVFKAQPGASHQQPPTFVIFTLKKVRMGLSIGRVFGSEGACTRKGAPLGSADPLSEAFT